MAAMSVSAAVCYFIIFLSSVECKEKHNISLVVMAPFPDDGLTMGWDRGHALFPATLLAVKEINNSTDILPEFNLRLIRADSGCSAVSKVTISFLRDIYENRDHQVVGIVGPGCSAAALRLSNLTRRPEVSLLYITPSASSPQLEERGRNTTYATISSALTYVQIFLELMRYNDWNSIATLQDEGRPYFKQTHTGFKDAVDSDKVRFTGSMFVGKDESVFPLDSLQSSQARVVFVFAGANTAAQMLCHAYHRGMRYPNYQWIFHDRLVDQLITNVTKFKVNGIEIECSSKQMAVAAEGVILNRFNLVQENRNTTLPRFQKTYEQYYEEYNASLMDGVMALDYGNAYHDAVWAMALALHNASMKGVDLTTYTYNRHNDTKAIAESLNHVDFEGMSGPIRFESSTRAAKTVFNIRQITNEEDKLIGTFDRTRPPGMYLKLSPESRFIDDVYEEKNVKIHAGLSVLLMLTTVVLVVIMFLLQLANTFWYNYHSIKATSPNITNLIFSGCYLFSIALLILSIQETFVFSADSNGTLYAVLCNLFTWCFILGYSLVFGTICAKIWRVYRLFRHFRNARPGRFLSDNALITFVILLLTVDIIICTTWNLVDPWMTQQTRVPSSHGNPTLFVRSECTCQHVTEWVITITLYKGMLMILLVALSILNRGIKRKDFQHTRKINILIYGVTMLVGVGMPLYFLLKHISIYISYIVLCALLLSTVSLSIFTLFLPPVLPVLEAKITGKEPAGPRRMRKSSGNLSKASLISSYYE